MFIALSFIGTLPSYIIESIYQIRLFFDGDIYLILNDISSKYLPQLENYNIKIIHYNFVYCDKFDTIMKNNREKFKYINGLDGREELFLRSIERIFLINNLMELYNLEDCIFLELDVLIYDDPKKWLMQLSKTELAYMYDNDGRCSSGIMYIKNKNSLTNLLDSFIEYINNTKKEVGIYEMVGLYDYYFKHDGYVQILPTFWNRDDIIEVCRDNYSNYNSIFDAANIGIYLFGLDTFHTYDIIKKGMHGPWGLINYTNEKFEWIEDTLGRKIPYITNGNELIRINNLHIHSKNLKEALSKDINI